MVILLGLTPAEFQARPNAPVFLKKRDIIHLNEIDEYLAELGDRVLQDQNDV